MLEALGTAIGIVAILGFILFFLIGSLIPLFDDLSDDPKGTMGGCGCLIFIILLVAILIYTGVL